MVILYEVEPTPEVITLVQMRLSVPFYYERYSKLIRLYDQDLVTFEAISEDHLELDSKVSKLLRRESTNRTSLLANFDHNDYDKNDLLNLTLLKNLIIKKSGKTNQKESDIDFAEYPLAADGLTQRDSVSKWYIGMIMVKPLVKYDVLFTTRSESKIIKE